MDIKKSSCENDEHASLLTPDAALQKIFTVLRRTDHIETITLRAALGRVLAHDITSTIDVPTATNSAMDGYAILAADIPKEGMRALSLVGASFAGKPFMSAVMPGQCVQIMTGAILPKGTDTVVIKENIVRVDDDAIEISPGIQSRENVRDAGEDIKKGAIALTAGTRLTPAHIGLIASLGIANVVVTKKIKVAFFSTGDEIRSVGEKLDHGAVYDSNRYTLFGMLARLDVAIHDMGVVSDDKNELYRVLRHAVATTDMTITTGGVSVGEADYVKEVLNALGQIHFWKVAMKPGRPLTFGMINQNYFFGLPGNPVSTMIAFYQFVQPALRRLAGEDQVLPLPLKVPCISQLSKNAGRVEYQRGILEKDATGRTVVRKTGAQGSGILRSMSEANCLIVLPMEAKGVQPGELVNVYPFHGLV